MSKVVISLLIVVCVLLIAKIASMEHEVRKAQLEMQQLIQMEAITPCK